LPALFYGVLGNLYEKCEGFLGTVL